MNEKWWVVISIVVIAVLGFSIYQTLNEGVFLSPVKKVAKQCNDHMDNDGNGYCDYKSKGGYCSDGSILGDKGCSSKTDNKEKGGQKIVNTTNSTKNQTNTTEPINRNNFTINNTANQTNTTEPINVTNFTINNTNNTANSTTNQTNSTNLIIATGQSVSGSINNKNYNISLIGTTSITSAYIRVNTAYRTVINGYSYTFNTLAVYVNNINHATNTATNSSIGLTVS